MYIRATSFAGCGKDDPDRPAALVLSLQATLMGCEWMLGEWAKLKAILDKGQPWLSSDKLKAVRLLGKQPFDAIDDAGRGDGVPGVVRAQTREERVVSGKSRRSCAAQTSKCSGTMPPPGSSTR